MKINSSLAYLRTHTLRGRTFLHFLRSRMSLRAGRGAAAPSHILVVCFLRDPQGDWKRGKAFHFAKTDTGGGMTPPLTTSGRRATQQRTRSAPPFEEPQGRLNLRKWNTSHGPR